MVISGRPRYVAVGVSGVLVFMEKKKCVRREEKKRFLTTFKTAHL